SIAAFIAVLAVRITVGSFNVLTDRAVMPPEPIEAVVRAVEGVLDCREVRTRGGPDSVYVDLVVHVDGETSLSRAHEVADRIESALLEAYPRIVDVVVHLEPAKGPR
ncbi:MAG TPA: cation transporter dimerization domain-containing protein, partial [Vicinamibacteria bacterium]|nr:cation transporter dimerization domain-containing protein [Vicinamibacteria bacterium]